MTDESSTHAVNCGHVLSARYIALMGILRGYVEADQASERPLMDEASHRFFLQIALKAEQATDEYHDVWGQPEVLQLLQGTEFASRLWS
jgi:hypothetical protein